MEFFMKFYLKILFLPVLLACGQSVLADPTKDLLKAIEINDIVLAKQAISAGADINFQVNTNQDLSATGWTPLMKAIAKLNSTIITTQSLSNTVHSIAKYSCLIGIASSVLYSAAKQSWYPIVIATAALGSIQTLVKPLIKQKDTQAVHDQYEIVKLLLAQPSIDKNHVASNKVSAAVLIEEGLDLLHSKYLCPPYEAGKPDKEYVQLLRSIKQHLPAQKINNQIQARPDFDAKCTNKTAFKTFDENAQLPIIFDPNYDITFGGLEKLHPFDTKKYGKVSEYLIKKLGLQPTQLHVPDAVSDQDLSLVHTKKYIDSLQSSWNLGLIADMPFLGLLPNKLAQKALLNPVKLATGGTILATDLALKHGWAINLSGGYHHAKSAEPVLGGFCIINDICIAAKKVLLQNPDFRILIVDLDAHQGNGHEEIEKNEPRIAIFDMFNGQTWPGDFTCQERINFRFPLKARTNDAYYLEILSQSLPQAIEAINPDLIIYNAGTDVYEKDPIGALSLSKEGIVKRDQIVFEHAMNRCIPIAMVLSGGYHADSHTIISQSIENLWNNVLKNKRDALY